MPRKTAAEAANTSGFRVSESGSFYCYVGPTLKNLIRAGTVFRGSREDALAQASDAIAAEPLVKTLIVSAAELPSAREKVRTPGNVLFANFRKLAGKDGN